jgi:hypothetical protein
MTFRHTSELKGQDCWWKALKQFAVRGLVDGCHMFRTVFLLLKSKL